MLDIVSKIGIIQSESNSLIDARMDFYGQYIRINEQVTLQNQDPICNKIQHGVYKSFLIDLEAYGDSYGDRAQAFTAA